MEHTKCLQLWESVRSSLSSRYGKNVVDSWIDSVLDVSYDSGIFCIYVRNRFSRDWIHQRYHDLILEIIRSLDSSISDIDVIVSEQGDQEQQNTIDEIFPNDISVNDEAPRNKSDTNNIGIALDPNLTFENFVVGKPNEFAYAAAMRIAESDSVVFNPLFLYGGVGLGKTHLMHAIAWTIKKRSPNRSVVYLSAEKFMYHFIKAVRYKDMMEFKDSFRSVDVLMIDDIQFICGKDSTQEEFFHTFNSLVDNSRQVIISADKSPSDLDGMEDRLKSRLGWGLVADIHPTSYELRLGILQSRIMNSKTFVPNKVLEFLANKITSNVRALEGALNRVIAHAEFVGKEITLDFTKDILSDLIRSNERKISVEDIQKAVANHYSIKISDITSSSRLKQFTLPRQVAMYLAKQLTRLSFPEIGRKFGGRDHTTVLHSVKKIEEALNADPDISSDIKYLISVIES